MNVLLWLIWLYQRIFRRYTRVASYPPPEPVYTDPLPEPGYNALRGPYGEPSGGDIADVPGLRWQEAMRIPPPGDCPMSYVPEDFQNPKNGHRP